MDERIQVYETKMGKTLNALESELTTIRAGRANPHILDKLTVDYYGAPTPLQQVANISVPEARMIQIQPWESSMIKAIEKAILCSDLGLNPSNDGKMIRLVFPELTEERRKELAKDVKKKDVLLMQINPTTGKVTFVAIEKLDKATGEVTATFDSLGPVMLIEKVPIVTKKVSPEKYADEKVADAAEKLKNQKAGFTLTDFIDDLTDTENKEITLDNGQTINLDDYVSASSLIDMAIKMSDDYSYDMSGSLDAQVNCDIDSVDWKSLVTANDADFDIDTAEGDLSLLTEIEPFTIPDSIVVQADASTGELNYLAEPELSFAYPEKEADDTDDTDETADAEDDLMSWIVKDEAGSSEQPNLVIKGEFKGMGPLAIFTKDAK